jgi:hypothetical protein
MIMALVYKDSNIVHGVGFFDPDGDYGENLAVRVFTGEMEKEFFKLWYQEGTGNVVMNRDDTFTAMPPTKIVGGPGF